MVAAASTAIKSASAASENMHIDVVTTEHGKLGGKTYA
jgi:hypothetical protein